MSTIQEELEKALGTALRVAVVITGSGRTDTGVHARGQVAHFDAPDGLDGLDEGKTLASLNGLLPNSIAALALEQAADNFHARFDAVRRCYRYHVSTVEQALDRNYRVRVPAKMNFEEMNRAAASLQGSHDFSAFCRTQSETENRVCTVDAASWRHETRPSDAVFEIVADRFLHGMVRAIVGTLFEIGLGKRSKDDIVRIIATRDRREAGPAAAARGLVLERVDYP